MFKFAHSYYFYLFSLIPLLTLLFIAFLIWRNRAMTRFGNISVISSLMPDASIHKLIIKFILSMSALALLVFTLAGPQTGSKIEKAKRTGIDIVIALDVSNSMLAEDIRPDRLERAKQAISKLIDKLDGDRIGLIIFAGKAFIQLPITTDYSAAKLFVSTVSTDIIPEQGTAIGDAIALSVKAFGESKNSKALIIISDGEDHQGDVLEQAETAVKKGISIYTIGIGSPEGAPIPEYKNGAMTGFKKDHSGKPVITKLDESLLQKIASVGGGMYVRATNSEIGLKPIFDELSKIQKSEIETKQFTDYESRFQYFLGLAMLLLVLDLFIYEKKTQWWKRIRPF
jgi:Ca-activated chloride channel family protein